MGVAGLPGECWTLGSVTSVPQPKGIYREESTCDLTGEDIKFGHFFSKLKISFLIHCFLSFLKEGDEARKGEGQTMLEF